MQADVVIIIPSRMAATRFPNKPLADVAGKPMIIRVIEQAVAADLGEIYVASGDLEIANVVADYGYKSISTDPKIPTGTDRVAAAYASANLNHPYIINLQGDLPKIDPKAVRTVLSPTHTSDITTLAVPITDLQADNPNTAKAVLTENGKVLYITRSKCPYGGQNLFQHVGIYCFTRPSLAKFVSLPPSPLELQEKLESLRALENNMSVHALITDTIPLEVNNLEDLEVVRKYYLKT